MQLQPALQYAVEMLRERVNFCLGVFIFVEDWEMTWCEVDQEVASCPMARSTRSSEIQSEVILPLMREWVIEIWSHQLELEGAAPFRSASGENSSQARVAMEAKIADQLEAIGSDANRREYDSFEHFCDACTAAMAKKICEVLATTAVPTECVERMRARADQDIREAYRLSSLVNRDGSAPLEDFEPLESRGDLPFPRPAWGAALVRAMQSLYDDGV